MSLADTRKSASVSSQERDNGASFYGNHNLDGLVNPAVADIYDYYQRLLFCNLQDASGQTREIHSELEGH